MSTSIGLPTPYQEFIAMSRYSRWIPSLNRRETWPEVVDRYIEYMFHDHLPNQCGYNAKEELVEEIRSAIVNLEVMPSMRALMTAGKALRRDAVCGYNCAYVAIDNQVAFDELLYVLMSGTGVGFSVERQYVSKLPEISETFELVDTIIVVEDSKEGWATSFRELIALLYQGKIPQWDLTKVRAAGVPLSTMGGRSSGPDPLVRLFKFTTKLFTEAAGRKLNSIECHSLCCMCGDIVVVGGVRRCIAAGSMVTTHNLHTQIPIESVRVGDHVLTKSGRFQEVVSKAAVGHKKVIEIHYEIGTQHRVLKCTPEHRIAIFKTFYDEPEWVQAGLLQAGDLLTTVTPKGFQCRVGIPVIRITNNNEIAECWDLEVAYDSSFQCEDILVHNSALISLSNPSDMRMRNAKSGQWWEDRPYFSLANNSIAHTEKPTMQMFFDEWKALYESKSGERGIFSRVAATKHIKNMGIIRDRIGAVNRDPNFDWGTNPCR